VHCFFLSFKQGLIDKYPEIFEGAGDEYTLESNFSRKWGWYQSIYAISQGDITRFDKVTCLGVHECLTYMAFEKDKVDLENKKIKAKFKR
jgi:hypothetical protein